MIEHLLYTSAVTAILIATGSNNILKALYTYLFAKNRVGRLSAFVLVLCSGFIYG